jgi:hypothetical protein
MRNVLRPAPLALLVLLAACSSKPISGFGDASPGADADIVDPNPDGGFKGGGDGSTVPACNPDPANYDIPGNGCDDDGDGTVDNGADCDANLAETGSAADFAKAIGLCQTASGPNDAKWGVISATYTRGFSTSQAPDARQHGILAKFGNVIKPRQGQRLGVLSSGNAREMSDPTCGFGFGTPGSFKDESCMMTGVGSVPPGFPKAAQGCMQDNEVNDVSVLKLKIKTPKNAKGLSFDFNFFSAEWPEYVCSNYNDAFIAYLKSSAFKNGAGDNISFDAKNNPVSVNNGFFDRCSPTASFNCNGTTVGPCPGGNAELQGTGFYTPEDHCFSGQTDSGGGATGWLTTKAPVAPGEVIDLEFYVFDAGDQVLDSSVLIDKFEWQASDTGTGTVRPPN